MADTFKSFDEWISEEIKKRRWTQNELARAAGLSSGLVSRIMNGQRPGLQVCKDLARALDLPIDTVLELAGHLPREDDLDPDLEQIKNIFRKLPPAARKALLGVAHSLQPLNDGDEQKPDEGKKRKQK